MASFSVVSNIASANAQSNLHGTQIGLQKALNRLSSGFRINMSGDDAAGLAVANSYRAEVAVISQGIRNANDGLSELQIKDGALNNISTLLDRLSTLATQAASGTTTSASRTTLQEEVDAIITEIDREATVAGLDGPPYDRIAAGGAATQRPASRPGEPTRWQTSPNGPRPGPTGGGGTPSGCPPAASGRCWP